MSNSKSDEPKSGFADFYEEFIVPTMSAQWAPRVADAANIKVGDKVLDVGCGTGVLSREAVNRVGTEGRVSGIDVNEDMLSAARRICPDVAWHHGDASELPFDNSSFDAVVSQFVLMFVPDRVATLKEMWRVLSPAGSLAVAVWWQSAAYPLLAEIARDRIGEEMATAVMDSFCLGDRDALLELFRSAGIATAKLHSHEGWGRFSSVEEFVRIEIKGWVEGQLDGGIDEDDYNKLLADARERLDQFNTSDGQAVIPMDAHIVTAEKI